MFEYQEKPESQFVLTFHAPFTADDEEAYLASLHALSDVRKPYVVIAIFGGNTHLSDEARKGQNLWFKAHRETLGCYCQGLVRVSANYGDDDLGQDTSNYGKAMPFPVLNVQDVDKARTWATALLAGETIG
ncbi:hypothetical protein [Terasakiella pusilla]|uniref:hypothetical protein n=1 Tax=Terasakiella pusilla TaxID=64973 RepID=UPI003AA943E5